MKKTALLLLGLAGFAAWATTPGNVQYQLPANFDPWDANFQVPLRQLEQPAQTTPAPRPKARTNTLARAAAAPSSGEFFFVGQKYHKNYVFYYDGGEICTYNIEVTVDGTKATISNLFNLEAQSTEYAQGVDYDIEGVYDADAGTITIPTPSTFSSATIAGTIGTYYTCVLAAGEVNTSGQMAPADELVLNVDDDLTTISSDMSFGIMNYTNDGSLVYGFQTLYRSVYASVPGSEPKLLAFNNSFDLGESYPGTPVSTTFNVVNVSNASADFAITMEADDNAFTSSPEAGVMDPLSNNEITFTFKAGAIGEYEGLATIDYESAAADARAVEVLLFGAVKPLPDYTPIVKSGDFQFNTSLEYPFEITTADDGVTVARSTIDGAYGTSWLEAQFEVPEGNIGKLGWKGRSTNTGYWYSNAGGIFIDDAGTAWLVEQADADISGTYEFAPGSHTVRFQYDGYYYTGDPKNGLYVYELELGNSAAPASSAAVETPEVDFGNFMIRGGDPVSGEQVIVLLNRGTDPLKVTSATSDDPSFVAVAPGGEASLLGTIEVPVTFNVSSAGTYGADITIQTTAGTFTVPVKALVRRMADFSSLVTEGADLVTGYDVSDSYPFEMYDGVAYNVNSGEADDASTTAWFQVNFTVPAGKVVYLEWDGRSYGHMPDPEYQWTGDYGMFEWQHPMSSGTKQVYGTDADAGSEAVFTSDDTYRSYLTCIPGDHYIKFQWYKNGDGLISENDRMEISAIRLRLEDFPEHAAEADVTEYTFDPIYVGPQRYLTTTVNIKNTGSSVLEITDVVGEAPFYGVIPDYATAQFNYSVEVGLWFYPSEEGEFSGKVTFKTTAGDIVVNCKGSTLSSEGILLAGDVEDQGYAWSYYDADMDGDCWNLGYNLWGEYPEWVHSGYNCFGSPSYTYYGGGIEPDNWLFSPAVSVPEGGAMLRWYAAAHHHERYAEHYSVYVASQEDIEDVANLGSLTSVFDETLEAIAADEWQEHTFDLAEYAGQEVHICFRHHDCDGQYVLKVDDIFVYTNDKWEEVKGGTGVADLTTEGKVVSTEIFDVNGIRLRQPKKGVNIVRNTYSDGSIKTIKLMVTK